METSAWNLAAGSTMGRLLPGVPEEVSRTAADPVVPARRARRHGVTTGQ